MPLLHLLLLAAGVAAAAVGSAAAQQPPAPTEPGDRPNIVIVLIDTLRADHLPIYGYERNTAPFLTGLAEESVVFDNAYSTASYTAPASASLFTSLYPEHHGVVLGQRATSRIREKAGLEILLNRIPEEAVTLPELLKEAGYSTYGLSDNYNVSKEMGFHQGFDLFMSNPTYDWGARKMNLRLEKWWEAIKRKSPYFLYVHYIDPHVPYKKHKGFFEESWEPETEPSADLHRFERLSIKGMPRYDSEIRYVDHHIGELYKLYGWDENTLLIITSDHGEEFFEHGRISHGTTLYDEVLRIPLMVHDSSGRLTPGRVPNPVSLIDILPTLAEFLGQPAPPEAQGESFLPLLRDESGRSMTSRFLFGHLERHIFEDNVSADPNREDPHERYRAWTALRGEWKLVVTTRGEKDLFRRSVDPGETKSVWTSFPDEAAVLSTGLQEHRSLKRVHRPERFGKRLSPEEMERLRSLGYVE